MSTDIARSALVAVVAISLSACATVGSPTAYGKLPPPDRAADDVVARSTIVRFLEAYARVPEDQGASLVQLAGSDAVRHWAGWLGIQYRQIDEPVEAAQVLRSIGPLEPRRTVGGAEARVAQISADIVFRITTPSGEVRQQVRSLDGPLVVILDPDLGWLVSDFTRDGVALSSSVHVFPLGTGVQERGVTMAVDSFIADRDQWAIGVLIRNQTGRTIGIDRGYVAIYDVTAAPVDPGTAPQALDAIRSGESAEALIAYPIPPDEDPTGLRLVVATRIPGDDRLVFLLVPVRPVLRTLERAGASDGPGSPTPAGSI